MNHSFGTKMDHGCLVGIDGKFQKKLCGVKGTEAADVTIQYTFEMHIPTKGICELI